MKLSVKKILDLNKIVAFQAKFPGCCQCLVLCGFLAIATKFVCSFLFVFCIIYI